jgi:hypothetical protein
VASASSQPASFSAPTLSPLSVSVPSAASQPTSLSPPAPPPSPAPSSPPAGLRSLSRAPLSRAGSTVLARAPDSSSSGDTGAGGGPAASGGAGGDGAGGSGEGGHDSDLIYSEVLARVRQEQEQLGQLINHPF